jgi:response regulator RpfG family c-di-GMP phosphodiesterase
MNNHRHFMIVDDDHMNNFICNITLKNTYKNSQITAFEKPVDALAYITTNYPRQDTEKTTLLLDINMPVLNGWEFLVELKQMDIAVVEQFDIYILSSSVDQRDMDKAKSDPHVIDFISKPLKKEKLMELFGTVE